MRYYDISISDTELGPPLPGYHFTSHPQGPTAPPDPGALQVEFDVQVGPFGSPSGETAPFIEITGIPLQQVSGPSLSGKFITVRAGMGKGLPLADPTQAGLILSGSVFQSFGNWLGTSMTLDFQVVAGPPMPDVMTFTWPKGTPLATAISNLLQTAFPNYKQLINISPKLVFTEDQQGFYFNLSQFSTYIRDMSAEVIGGDYGGVDIALSGTTFHIYDGTTPKTPKQIKFTDMMGQATWIEANVIQVTTVMRGDLTVNDYIKLPPGQIAVLPGSQPIARQGSVFQGAFRILSMRHAGLFRNPDGESWITTFNCAPTPGAPGNVLSSQFLQTFGG